MPPMFPQRILDPGTLPAEALKDAIVLVGAQGQVVKTPLGPSSIANVVAEGVENLLRVRCFSARTGRGRPKPC